MASKFGLPLDYKTGVVTYGSHTPTRAVRHPVDKYGDEVIISPLHPRKQALVNLAGILTKWNRPILFSLDGLRADYDAIDMPTCFPKAWFLHLIGGGHCGCAQPDQFAEEEKEAILFFAKIKAEIYYHDLVPVDPSRHSDVRDWIDGAHDFIDMLGNVYFETRWHFEGDQPSADHWTSQLKHRSIEQ